MSDLVSLRQQIGQKSLDELADWMAYIGNSNEQVAKAEFQRRQTLFAEDAAKAAKDTAQFTKASARYILWSVGVLAASSVATFLVDILKH
jgi:hypothetical protein